MLAQEHSNMSIFNCNSDSNLFQYRVIAEKLESDLIKFGLTSNQVKVFLYLSKYGEQTAPDIFKSLSLPRTETYQILNSLQNKGIVTSKLCHPTIFSPLPINEALLILINSEKRRIANLENDESKLVELWKQIPTFDSTNQIDNEKLQMLQGNNVIFAKMLNMFKTTKNDIKILCSEKDLLRFYNEGFFEELQTKNKPKFLIMSDNKKTTKRNKLKNITCNYFSNKELTDQCFIITESSEILFFIRNTKHSKSQTFAFSTTSYPLIQSLELLFDNIWYQNSPKDNSEFSNITNSANPAFLGIKKFRDIMSNFDDIELENPNALENIELL